jgi:hypothetical protein
MRLHPHAKVLNYLLMALCIVGCRPPEGDHSSDSGNNPVVQTAQGRSLMLRKIRSVHFPELPEARPIDARRDSDGNPRYQMLRGPGAAVVADVIPLEIGHGFGFDFECPQIEGDDELLLDAEIYLPQHSSPVATTYRYTASSSGTYTFIVWGFREDRPDYHIAGIWKIRLRNSGREVYSHMFNVKATESAGSK